KRTRTTQAEAPVTPYLKNFPIRSTNEDAFSNHHPHRVSGATAPLLHPPLSPTTAAPEKKTSVSETMERPPHWRCDSSAATPAVGHFAPNARTPPGLLSKIPEIQAPHKSNHRT